MRTVLAAACAVLVTASSVSAQVPGDPAQVGPFSVSAEALIWWFKASPAPVPLVTDGIIGEPGTKLVLGGRDLDTGANPGFRVTAGYAFGEQWGIEGSFFYILPRSIEKNVSSSGEAGSTNLIVPFFDVTTGRENGTALSLAPVFAGVAQERLENSLLGGDLNVTWALAPDGPLRVDLLAGLRYLRLRERYTLSTSSPFIPPFPQDIWGTKDEFDATNNFYGGQVGVRGRFDWGRLSVTGVVKFAAGAMVQSLDVSGSFSTNDFTNFGPTQTFLGGYFALPTNIGSHTRTVFAVLPEVGVNVGFQITPWLSVYAGYNFLYVNNVVRPANQLDRNINPTQSVLLVGEPPASLQGIAAPAFQFNGSEFWAQGANVGLTIRF